MSYLKRNGLSHRDWFIQLVHYNSGFGFCCHHQSLGSHTNGTIYPSAEVAIIAGCNFVNREQAVMALEQVLNEWMNADKISMDEYLELSNFCGNPD